MAKIRAIAPAAIHFLCSDEIINGMPLSCSKYSTNAVRS